MSLPVSRMSVNRYTVVLGFYIQVLADLNVESAKQAVIAVITTSLASFYGCF